MKRKQFEKTLCHLLDGILFLIVVSAVSLSLYAGYKVGRVLGGML